MFSRGGLIILLACAAITGCYSLSPPSTARPTLSNVKLVYLTPDQVLASEDIPGGTAALAAEGVTLVFDENKLIELVERREADAVILPRSRLINLDHELVRRWYRDGIIIVGINVKGSELSDILHDPSIMAGQKTESWYRAPYYTFAFVKLYPNGGSEGSGTDNIRGRQEILQMLYAVRLAASR